MTTYDLVIIGAGPAGIEAGLQAKAAGMNYLLLERFDAGSYIDLTMRNKKFYHVYGKNTTQLKGDLAFPDRARGFQLVELWKKQAAELSFKPEVTLQSLTKNADGVFILSTTRGEYQTKNVLLTSGTFESRKRLGVEGEEGNEKVIYEYDYYTEYEQEQIIVVGGGNSALETAIAMAEGDDNHVSIIVRKPAFHKSATETNLKAIQDFVDQKKVTIFFESAVSSITSDEVQVSIAGKIESLPYDRLFVHVGFEQPTEFLNSLGIKLENNNPVFNEQFESSIAGLFIAGALTGADSVIESSNQAYEIVRRLAKENK